MLFDMGVEIQAAMTVVETQQLVDAADKVFDLVLVSERIDESLILMKEFLCWNFDDIVFFTKNARRKEKKHVLSPEDIHKLEILNSADMILYNHFLVKHEKAVLHYGQEKMDEQITILNKHRDEMFKKCNIQVVDSFQPDSIFKEFSDQVDGYVIDTNASDECILLTLPELSLVEAIRAKHERLLNQQSQQTKKNIDKY